MSRAENTSTPAHFRRRALLPTHVLVLVYRLRRPTEPEMSRRSRLVHEICWAATIAAAEIRAARIHRQRRIDRGTR